MSPGKVRHACHAVLTNIWQDMNFFSLNSTILVATRKGKDTILSHLERLEMLAMLCWPIFGRIWNFFTLRNYSGGYPEGEGHNSMSPGKVRNACHAFYFFLFSGPPHDGWWEPSPVADSDFPSPLYPFELSLRDTESVECSAVRLYFPCIFHRWRYDDYS